MSAQTRARTLGLVAGAGFFLAAIAWFIIGDPALGAAFVAIGAALAATSAANSNSANGNSANGNSGSNSDAR